MNDDDCNIDELLKNFGLCQEVNDLLNHLDCNEIIKYFEEENSNQSQEDNAISINPSTSSRCEKNVSFEAHFEQTKLDAQFNIETSLSSQDIASNIVTQDEACYASALSKDNTKDKEYVRYGKGLIRKNSQKYFDMRKRNNRAIHKCRAAKSKEFKNDRDKLQKFYCDQVDIVTDLIKEIEYVTQLLTNHQSNDEYRHELDKRLEQLNKIVTKINNR